jgi:hypothetical protein
MHRPGRLGQQAEEEMLGPEEGMPGLLGLRLTRSTNCLRDKLPQIVGHSTSRMKDEG